MPLYSTACPLPINRKIFRHKVASAFSPTNITGLSLWLKADAGVSISGTQVTGWEDQSSSGYDAQAFDLYPDYIASGLNGKPVISLSEIGTEDNKCLEIIGGNPMGASGTTAFAVVFVDDVCDNTDNNGPIFGNFGTANTSSHYPYGGDCYVYDGFASTTRKEELTAPVTITDSWSLYSVLSTTNDWRAYVNGELMHSDSGNVYSGVPLNSQLFIGASDFGYLLKGKIAESIVYNRVITNVERQQVETYLNDKYAIY